MKHTPTSPGSDNPHIKPKPWHNKHPQYYESILQLRDINPEQLEHALKAFHSVQLPIPKTVAHKNGIDLYTASFRITRNVAKSLQRRYGGIITITPKLFSQKDGRKIYRMTILYRAPPFCRGDTILYRSEPYTITHLQEKIILQSPRTGRKVQLKCTAKDFSLLRPSASS